MASTERLAAALAGRYRIERQLGEGGMAAVSAGGRRRLGTLAGVGRDEER